MDEPHWLTHARTYLGTREIPGPQHNPLIVKWWEEIKAQFRDDETAWCAAFVGGNLEECGYRSSRNAAARSYMNWGARLDYPAVGAITVLSRPGSSWSGHVAYLVGFSPTGRLLLLGGNQGDAVSVASFDPARLLAYRWPLPIVDNRWLPIHFKAVPTLTLEAASSSNET